jgi:hypothetical protein
MPDGLQGCLSSPRCETAIIDSEQTSLLQHLYQFLSTGSTSSELLLFDSFRTYLGRVDQVYLRDPSELACGDYYHSLLFPEHRFKMTSKSPIELADLPNEVSPLPYQLSQFT